MFKSFKELRDWICPMRRWCVLARLRDAQRNEWGVDSPFSCWVCTWFPFLLLSRECCGCSVASRDRGAAAGGGLWVGADPQQGWLWACSLERMGNGSSGTAAPLLLICSCWRPGLGSWKEDQTFLSLEGFHSSVWGLGASPYSLFQCLWGLDLY